MEYTKEQIMELDRDKFVSDIVSEILKKDAMDHNEIIECALVDYGNSIDITIKGSVYISTIKALGEAFGDNDPLVFGNGDAILTIFIINKKCNWLIVPTATDD